MVSEYYVLGDDGRTPLAVGGGPDWKHWMEASGDRRVVARSKFPGGTVSTLFMGSDKNCGRGDPLLFQTMVFGGPLDKMSRAYRTWKQARAGHDSMVEACFVALDGTKNLG